MRKNISWTKKIALAVAAGAIMVAGSVSAMAADACPHVWQDVTDISEKATCQHTAYTVKYCGLCGEVKKVESGKANQTTYTTATITIADSAKEQSKKQGSSIVSLSIKYCKNCGEVVNVTSVAAEGESNHTDDSYDTYYVKGTDFSNITLNYNNKYGLTGSNVKAELTDAEKKACGETVTTIKICKTCGLVTATSTTNPDHEFELEDVMVATATEKGSATLKCKNCDTASTKTIETYPTDCVAGNHVTADESKGKCVNCGIDTTKLTNDADATEPAEEPSEEPAETTETKVSSGTVVGGGIAAAGILTLITLIVKYLGSVLF
jgi:hypothetical protein